MNPISAFDGMVVLTSISLVFCMLVALCLILNFEGRIFDALAHRKAAARNAHQESLSGAAPASAAAAVPAAPAPAAPAGSDGVPPEVVAAISAAVYYMEGQGAVIRGIRRLPAATGGRRRGAWGDAGVAQNVRPFCL